MVFLPLIAVGAALLTDTAKAGKPRSRSFQRLERYGRAADIRQYLRPGDHILAESSLIDHDGIYVGPVGPDGEDVIHCSLRQGCVRFDHLEEFIGDGRFYHVGRPASNQCQQVVQRALAQLGEPYGLVDNNCEHLSSQAMTGDHSSRTVDSVIGSLAFGAMMVVAAL